jgi:hypothetical protein
MIFLHSYMVLILYDEPIEVFMDPGALNICRRFHESMYT